MYLRVLTMYASLSSIFHYSAYIAQLPGIESPPELPHSENKRRTRIPGGRRTGESVCGEQAPWEMASFLLEY